MKRIFFSLMLLAAFAGFIRAEETPLAVFRQGNQLYEQGQYRAAIATYESLRTRNEINAAVLYNLGNAYYRDGQIGRALLNYERAARLAPRDRDIRRNISFLRQTVREPEPSFFTAVLKSLGGLISLNELTAVTSFFFLLSIAAAIVYLFRRRQLALLVGLGAVLAFLVCAGGLAVKLTDEVRTVRGVVVAGPADVRNGPGAENSVGFTLSEGRTLVILAEKDDWTAVALPVEGLQGWIEKKYLERI